MSQEICTCICYTNTSILLLNSPIIKVKFQFRRYHNDKSKYLCNWIKLHVYCCDGLAYLSLWNQWVQLDIMNPAYILDFATFSVFTVLYIYS